MTKQLGPWVQFTAWKWGNGHLFSLGGDVQLTIYPDDTFITFTLVLFIYTIKLEIGRSH